MKRCVLVLFTSSVLVFVGCGSDDGGGDAGQGSPGGDGVSGDVVSTDDDTVSTDGDALDPGDDAEGPTPSDGCGECPDGTVCGLDEEAPVLCVGSDCGDVDFAGECAGDSTVIWCEDGLLFARDCAATQGEEYSCGWNEEEAYFDCIMPPPDDTACGGCPDGTICGLDPVNPEACVGGECGEVDDIGMCQTDGALVWCEEGVLLTMDCAISAGEGYTCGFDDAEAFYSCVPPPPDDLCLNDADIAVLEASDVSAATRAAAIDCLISGAEDMGACVMDAITAATGVSVACGSCYVGAVNCVGANCFDLCVPDPSTEACVACEAEHCGMEFYLCSGFVAGCGNGICEASEDTEGCLEDCPAEAACDMMCLAGCDDAAFQCPLDCADGCGTQCTSDHQDCMDSCAAIPSCLAACSDDKDDCDATCAAETSDCHLGCAPAQAACAVGCGCE